MAAIGLERALKMFVMLANRRKDLNELMPDNTTIQFEIDDGREFFLDFGGGKLSVHDGRKESPTATIRSDSESFIQIMKGELKQDEAFFMRKVEVSGPITYLVRLNKMSQQIVNSGGLFTKFMLRFVG
ncbi:MAG: SCP2 sterol-binding domain-containing protein [Nitrososphaerota archaeon]|nr:SCP2 sterol-binding domain-containing protein [Nitrososphaerota archaeon]MDG7026497.1 SCP2 sterol-binding domain-containing protein [Nitrososphaerota archaeon]